MITGNLATRGPVGEQFFSTRRPVWLGWGPSREGSSSLKQEEQNLLLKISESDVSKLNSIGLELTRLGAE